MLRKVAFGFLILLVFLIPVEEIYTIPGFGTVTRLAGLLAAGFWVVMAVFTDRIRKPHLFHWLFIIFVLWNLTSTIWTIGLERTSDRLITFVQLIGLTWIMWDLVTESSQFKAVMQAFILGSYLAIGDTFKNFLASTFAVSTSGGVSMGRFSATGFNPNDLSLMLVLAMPVAWFLVLERSHDGFLNKALKFANVIFMPAAIFTILLTASRGSFFTMIPVLLLLGLHVFRLSSRQRLGTVVAAVLCVVIIVLFVPQTIFERLGDTSASVEQGEFDGRVDIWAQGFEVFVERPLLGVGSSAFRLAIDLGSAPHNSYLSVLVDLGLVGLILFGAIIITVMHQAWQHPKWQRLIWLTVLLAWLIGNMVHNWENRKPTWFFLSLIVVSANVTAVYRKRPQTSDVQLVNQASKLLNKLPSH